MSTKETEKSGVIVALSHKRNTSGLRPFQKGHPGGPGRPKGSHNRPYRLMSDIMEQAAAAVGSDDKGKDGYLGWLEKMCRVHPVEFLWVLARLQPQKFNMRVEEVKVDVNYETVAEAEEALRQAGLIIDASPTSSRTHEPEDE